MDFLEDTKKKLSNDYVLVISVFGAAFSIFCLYPDIIKFSNFVKLCTDNYLLFLQSIISKLVFFLPIDITRGDAAIISISVFMIIYMQRCFSSSYKNIRNLKYSNHVKFVYPKTILFSLILCFLLLFPIHYNTYEYSEYSNLIISIFLAVYGSLICFYFLYKISKRRRVEKIRLNYLMLYNMFRFSKITIISLLFLFGLNLVSVVSENTSLLSDWLLHR